jgi:hypothetical protein
MKVGGTSGLDIPLAGLVALSQSFMYLNSNAYFYTSTESGSNAWRRCLSSSSPLVGRYNTFPKSYAFSVRCIKGPDTTTVSTGELQMSPVLFVSYENHELFVGYHLNENAEVILNLYDISGRNVFQQSADFSAGKNAFNIRLPRLASGIYIVRLNSKKLNHCGKILIP